MTRLGRLKELGVYVPLVSFMWPLVITQTAPEVAEQALNRGITSLATKEMVELLAVFGLAHYYVKLVTGAATELRQIAIVLVKSRSDYLKMLWLSVSVGCVATFILILTGGTPMGSLLYEQGHLLEKDVSELTKLVILYLCPIPLLEAVAKYHEGGLIKRRLTILAGAGTLVDCAMQVTFTIYLLFTPTRTDPLLIPIFALYAGYSARLILCTGFFYVYVYRSLQQQSALQPLAAPVKISAGLLFWLPLVLVRAGQLLARPLINTFVARSAASEPGGAVKALAILSAIYPVNRTTFVWLNELRAIPPTFIVTSSVTGGHSYTPRQLASFSAVCTSLVLLVSLLLFWLPGSAYGIIRQAIGLSPELAEASIVPIQICTFICITVGVRAHVTGLLLNKKITAVLAPSSIVRTGLHVAALIALPAIGLQGATMGATSLLLSFVAEAASVCTGYGIVVLLERFRDKKKRCSNKVGQIELSCNDNCQSQTRDNH